MKNIILSIIFFIAVVVGFYLLSKIPADKSIEEEIKNNQEIIMEDNKDQGLKIDVLAQGTGEEAKNGDRVSLHYTGTLEDGTKFDSSLDRGQPFTFLLGSGQVIKGWDLGVLGMKIGEKRKLTISSDLGYGETGTPGGPIPPNATLIFEVELLGINE